MVTSNDKIRKPQIRWNEGDYKILFPALDALTLKLGHAPDKRDGTNMQTAIDALPVDRRKTAWVATCECLLLAWSAWLRGKNLSECVEIGKQNKSYYVKKSDVVASVQPKSEPKQQDLLPPVAGTLEDIKSQIAALEAEVQRKLEEEKAEAEKKATAKKAEEKRQEDEQLMLTAEAEQRAKKLKEAGDKLEKEAREKAEAAKVAAIQGEVLPELLDIKLKPIVDMLQQLLTGHVIPAEVAPTVSIQLPAEVAVIHQVPPVEHYHPKDGDVEKKHMFSVSEIRAIIREEIEKIFGSVSAPAGAEAVVIPAPAATVGKKLKTTGEKTPVAIVPTAPVVPEKRYSIYVYGLDSVQMSKITKQMPDRITIKGSTTWSHGCKDSAKNCDLVVLSRFVKHSIEQSFQSVCGKEKVEFVSGGMTMIMRRINEFVIAQDKL